MNTGIQDKSKITPGYEGKYHRVYTDVFSKLITVHKCHVRYYVMAINLSTFLIETKKNVQARRVRIVLL